MFCYLFEWLLALVDKKYFTILLYIAIFVPGAIKRVQLDTVLYNLGQLFKFIKFGDALDLIEYVSELVLILKE